MEYTKEYFEKAELYQLCYAIRYLLTDEQINWADEALVNKITDKNTLDGCSWSLTSNFNKEKMPKTLAKCSDILRSSDVVHPYEFQRYYGLMNEDTVNYFVSAWLSDKINTSVYYFRNQLCAFTDRSIYPAVIEKLVGEYKKSKSGYMISTIETVLLNANKDDLPKCCELLSKSTPAVRATMLSVEDAEEKYVISALKAVGKLSSNKKIAAKIDFKNLSRLGPKSRLIAMQHLLKIKDNDYIRMIYYRDNKVHYASYYTDYYADSKTRFVEKGGNENPFIVAPTKEEFASFLFPCLVNNHKEVSELVERYNDVLENTVSKTAAELNKNVEQTTGEFNGNSNS